jgi:hypothetical protein
MAVIFTGCREFNLSSVCSTDHVATWVAMLATLVAMQPHGTWQGVRQFLSVNCQCQSCLPLSASFGTKMTDDDVSRVVSRIIMNLNVFLPHKCSCQRELCIPPGQTLDTYSTLGKEIEGQNSTLFHQGLNIISPGTNLFLRFEGSELAIFRASKVCTTKHEVRYHSAHLYLVGFKFDHQNVYNVITTCMFSSIMRRNLGHDT